MCAEYIWIPAENMTLTFSGDNVVNMFKPSKLITFGPDLFLSSIYYLTHLNSTHSNMKTENDEQDVCVFITHAVRGRFECKASSWHPLTLQWH